MMNVDNKKALEDYLLFKKTKINTHRKLKDLERYIGNFLNTTHSLKEYDEDYLIKYLNSIKVKYSIRSLNDIKQFTKSFIKWYYTDFSLRFRHIDSLCESQKAINAYSPEDMLSIEDIEKLVQAEDSKEWKTFFLVYFYSASRPSEICKLKWKDVTFDDDGAFIKIYSDKNKEFFDKFIPSNVAHYLKLIQNNKSDYVFPSRLSPNKDEPIKINSVYFRLKNLSQKALNRHINPYILRHSALTHLYNRDDLKDSDVAKQGGHNKSMRKTYDNYSKDKLRAKLKRMWIKPEDLPEEKKHELETKIEGLKQEIKEIKEILAFNQKTYNKYLEAKKLGYKGIILN